jgi:hypothetical protein
MVGVAGALGSVSPVEARVEQARQSLEARVLAVRSALRDAAEADVVPGAAPDSSLAQWMNWGNWNNWNNWPNWGNWGNWFNR